MTPQQVQLSEHDQTCRLSALYTSVKEDWNWGSSTLIRPSAQQMPTVRAGAGAPSQLCPYVARPCPQTNMAAVGGQACARQGMLQTCQHRQENRRVSTNWGTAHDMLQNADASDA